MLFYFYFLSLVLSSQIPFTQKTFQPSDLNWFMAFAGQDLAVPQNIKDDLRYISNSAALASIPKGKIMYHLTNVDPKLNDPQWEPVKAVYFCTLPEHCLLYSGVMNGQYLLSYQVLEDIDELIYFSGSQAWISTYSPFQAFLYGNVSHQLFDNPAPFCQHELKPKGWVTSYIGSFEFVLCNRYKSVPPFLKFIQAVPITRPKGVLPGTLLMNQLIISPLNDFVNVHYGTLTLLNPGFQINVTMERPYNLPGYSTTQQQAKAFQKRLFDYFKDETCWKESKQFLAYERNVRMGLKPFLNTLYAIFSMPIPDQPSYYILSLMQGYLFSIIKPYHSEILDHLFLPLPRAESPCGKKMLATYQSIYESSQRVLKMVHALFEELYVGEINANDDEIVEKYQKILNGLIKFRNLFGTIQIKLPVPSQ